MNKRDYYIYKTDNFSINIPSNWKIEISDFVYSIYNPLGVGALQISTYYRKDNEDNINLEEEIKKFSKLDIVKKLNEIKREDYSYIEIDFIKGEFYTKVRIIRDNLQNLALLTYNCKKTDKNNKELDIVNSVFDSFKLLKNEK